MPLTPRRLGPQYGGVETLLRDLGPLLRRADAPGDAPPCCATGLPDVDQLLGGGFPRGRLSEIAGPASCGRTSLALALLARATAAGESVAVVDAADAFDPTSAAAAGVDLGRVLWVRAPGLRETLVAAERLLGARGFALVLLDLARPGVAAAPPAAWPRLRRAAAATQTALVVLGRARSAGSCADLALALGPAQPRFTGTPALLEGLEAHVLVERSRCGPGQRAAPVLLRVRPAQREERKSRA
jgi:hypothetical protein